MRPRESENELDSLYRTLLWRDPGPVDRARFSGPRLLLHGRVAWRLRRDREYREFIRPLVSLSTSLYVAMCGREPRPEETQSLINGFRSRFATLDDLVQAVVRARRSGVSLAAIAHANGALFELFDELLARPPDSSSLARYCARMLMGLATVDDVRREVLESSEYREFIRPLVSLSSSIYTAMCDRAPSRHETRSLVDKYRSRFSTLDEQVRAVPRASNGRAVDHTGPRETRQLQALE